MGKIEELGERYSKAISPEDKGIIEKALIEGITVCERRKQNNRIANLANVKNLPDIIMLKIVKICRAYMLNDLIDREDLSDAVTLKLIETYGKIARLPYELHYNRSDFREEISKLLDKLDLSYSFIVKDLLELCKEDAWITSIFIDKKDLSDELMIKAIKICGEQGFVANFVRYIVDRKDLSDAVKNQVEVSFIESIKVCAEKEGIRYNVEVLLGRKDLSDAVKNQVEVSIINGMDKCAEIQGSEYLVEKLLSRGNLSVKLMIKAIEVYIKYTGIDKCFDLLDREDLSKRVKRKIKQICEDYEEKLDRRSLMREIKTYFDEGTLAPSSELPYPVKDDSAKPNSKCSS